MKSVSLAEARANIAELFDEVARGESVTINPDHASSAAGISETEEQRVARVRRAIDGIVELRKHTKPVSADEIIAWKNEGRE